MFFGRDCPSMSLQDPGDYVKCASIKGLRLLCPPWFSREVRRYWRGPPVATRCGSCGHLQDKLRGKLGPAVVRAACLPNTSGQVMSAWTAKCRTALWGWMGVILAKEIRISHLGLWMNPPAKIIPWSMATGDNSKLIGCHSAIRDSAVGDLRYVWCAFPKFVQP